MIYESLEIIKDQVSSYLNDKTGDANLVVLENIAKIDDPQVFNISDKVVLSLINLEEEAALKNQSRSLNENGETVYKNHPIHLNLYLLFSINRSGYDKSLIALSGILEFFQGKKVFTQSNTPLNPVIPALTTVTKFRFTVDLYTPTFEQQNYVWGTLGGKSLPSAMFKVSLVTIDRETIQEKGVIISQLTQEANPI